METAAPIPYIINTGNNGGIVKPLIIVGGGAALLYFGNQAWKKYQERQGEKNLDTPEGKIAMQLKTVFETSYVNDEDFRKIYLQVNDTNKDEIFKLYRQLTQRNLSDDIASRIKTGTLVKAAKTEAINNKKNGVIKISSSEDIKFLVAKNSKVVFSEPAKTITLYASPKGLLWNLTAEEMRPAISAYDKIKISLVNRKDVMLVDATMILPYEGLKMATDWTKYFKPIVRTRKVFAIVRIALKAKDGTSKYLWADARELSLAPTTLKGLQENTSAIHLAF